MTVSLVEYVLMVKLSYENKRNAFAVIPEFGSRKSCWHKPTSTKCIRSMIKGFEKTRELGVQRRRGCKCVTQFLAYAFKAAVNAYSHTSEFGASSTPAFS
ncbi:hypothetical protein TNCT_219681 [Trichonephila clavata]|uniref:Uncharacterized protein n=1 Tax=Trichonephila clavata TaxID=2740835 RepID=A0A8X6GSB4_TRICU|nr:hypothetical protein TNCT_219681 [Trichonephila clavata]